MTRTLQYIDTSEATEKDRIRIKLEDGATVVLRLSTFDERGDVTVDKNETTPSVLMQLYKSAVKQALENARRRERKLYTLATADEQVNPWVRLADEDSWSLSDYVKIGDRLEVWALFPKLGGSPTYLSPSIADIQFVSIP